MAMKAYGSVNYTLKLGVILLLPFDDTYSDNMEDSRGKQSASDFKRNSAFVELNIPKNIKVDNYGIITVNAVTNAGTVPMQNLYSQIKMGEGSKLNVLGGGTRNSKGYIYGDGNLEVQSGANVREAFMIHDFRGGTRTLGALFPWLSGGIYREVFPFNYFSINNIEVNTKINSGANYYAFAHVNMSKSHFFEEIKFIGDGGLIGLESGYVNKSFNPKNAKMTFDLYGDGTINDISVYNVITTLGKEIPLSGLF